ncbi:MAG: sulfatase [Myxococcota bacterium]|nr:sulfatase [Myxococcales bacterium]
MTPSPLRHRPPSSSRARRTARAFALVASLALAAALPGCGRGARAPLLLLVTVDTLRADHLGAYGSDLGATPRIDALASQSVAFDAAFAPASYTLPSMASLHTGLYPEEVGIFANRSAFRGSSVTVAEMLRIAGWRTGAAVSNYVLRGGTGMEIGFDVYDDAFTTSERNRDQPERTAEATTAAALAVLDALRASPHAGLFLWVHYQDVHGPYEPPAGLRERYLARARATRNGSRTLPTGGINAMGAIPSYQVVDGRDDAAFYLAGYAGEVAFVDAQIGALLDGVDARGLLDDARVVFTADHGESLGEDDYWFAHGELLSDALVRVPLLVRAPGLAPGRRADVASMVDLLPTLAGLAGLPLPARSAGRDLLAAGADRAPARAYLATLMGASTQRWGWVEDGHVLVRTDLGGGRVRDELRSLDRGAGGAAASAGGDDALRRRMGDELARFREELDVADAAWQELGPQDRAMLERLGYAH